MRKIAKPSLLMTQFARQVAFMAKFRACANVKIYFCKKLLAKFGVKFSFLSDDELLAKFQSIAPNVKELRQFKKQSKTPICVVKFEKDCPVKELFSKLLEFREFFQASRCRRYAKLPKKPIYAALVREK